MKAMPHRHGDPGDQPGDPAHLMLERALLRARPAPRAPRSAPARFRIPVAKTSARASPPVQSVPLKTRSRAWISGRSGIEQVGGAGRGRRLAGQRRHVDLDRALDQPRVGGDSLALGDREDVARNEPGGVDLVELAVAEHPRLRRQVAPQRLDRALGLPLLGESEAGVEDDHDDDGDRHRGDPRHRSESGRAPEQQRQRMRELPRQLARPAPGGASLQLVRVRS